MIDNEFMLSDRLAKIKSTIEKFGESNFYISFSGGRDSCVVHELVDMAIPGNNIPRVYINTGIEYKMISDFVNDKASKDNRIVVLHPAVNIRKVLDEYGYPFKSKFHSEAVYLYDKYGLDSNVVQRYLSQRWKGSFKCPNILRYQFSETSKMNFKISDKCCEYMKEIPVRTWCKDSNKPYGILGIRQEEGGRRLSAKCLAYKNGKLRFFNPLAVVTKDWQSWFIHTYNISICDIYKPPYNFERTGCKGCPFCVNLQEELNTLQKYFPFERKQCEIIWKPVYAEYRRLGYRLCTDTCVSKLF